MNTKLLTEKIMEIMDRYNFITEYPFDVNLLKSEIETQINKEYMSTWNRPVFPMDFTTGDPRCENFTTVQNRRSTN